MKAVYVQKGSSFDIVPAADIAAGDVVVSGDLIGIAKLDISAGTLGSLHRKGMFDVVKDADDDFIRGDKVYWDDTGKKATSEATNNKLLGLAAATTAEGDERVRVILG